MKLELCGFLLISVFCASAQKMSDSSLIKAFQSSTSERPKITNAFVLAEYYLETDDIQSSQKWLDKTKDLLIPTQKDTTAIFIHSLQSELFYYEGLFQFGTNEAEKAVQIAKECNDSLWIANGYFFKGINLMEMNAFKRAEKALLFSKKFQPKTSFKKHIRSSIENEHIYNNIAQLKLKMNQSDSAVWYNSKAYRFALNKKSARGIPNVEQTFGQIYLLKKNQDSAIFYFKKSVLSAQKSNYFDIVLLNYGLLMECYPSDAVATSGWFQKGLNLIDEKIVNTTYQRYFYKIAQTVFKKNNQLEQLAVVQEKIIAIDDETQLKGNLYIQNITNQYTKNETKLLKFQVEELKKQRKFTILQLIAAVLSVGILLLIIVIIRRKNRTQLTLLDQKNEISKDLHDDIGSGLSSILIHADLLLKNPDINEKQKALASKINLTGREISQRLNAFIWSLNTEHNTVQHFSEYFKAYATSLFEETPISFSFYTNVPHQETIKMNGQQRKNVLYALKEVCNNTLKHSGASSMEMNVRLLPTKQLQIILRDNGSGNVKESAFGNGIKNIHNRVKQLNGTFEMQTDNGLISTICIPI